MCGISGIISKKRIEKDIIEPMTDTIIHRGPDGFGYYYGENFVFGHRRLSILDLSLEYTPNEIGFDEETCVSGFVNTPCNLSIIKFLNPSSE